MHKYNTSYSKSPRKFGSGYHFNIKLFIILYINPSFIVFQSYTTGLREREIEIEIEIEI